MNILHITTFLQGGAGRIITQLAVRQKRDGNNVHIITDYDYDGDYNNYPEYLKILENESIPVHKVNSTFKRDLYLNMSVVERARGVLESYNIDIIHTHAAVPSMVGIIAKAGINKHIPIIQTMHGWGNNKTAEQEKMDITIMNGLERVITVSETSKKLLMSKGLNRELIDIIYYGISHDRADKNTNREIYNRIKDLKSNGYKIIGCIGTICSRKNQQCLVNAVSCLDIENKFKCLLIGEGDLIEGLKKTCKELNISDKVEFWGYRKNADEYIKYFDCLVLPSLSEGMPITLLEGFRERAVILGSDIPEIKEIIKNKETGYLFESNNYKSLAQSLCEVLSIEAKNKESILCNAEHLFISNFAFEHMMDKYYKLYADITECKKDYV